eukprot:612388-Prymnesium_polylepis.1
MAVVGPCWSWGLSHVDFHCTKPPLRSRDVVLPSCTRLAAVRPTATVQLDCSSSTNSSSETGF